MSKNEVIDALILDVDGTLWDSTPIVAKAWTRAVREVGYRDMTVEADRLKELFGRTMDEIAAAMIPDASREKQQELMDKCVSYEQDALENDPCDICYPDVIETIKELSKVIPVCIVSNCQSGYIELFMNKTHLTGKEICCTSCFGDTGKGKAENLEDMVKRNGYRNAFYVGDTEGDRIAVRKAGLGFIAADYGFGDPKEADYRIKSFAELKNITGHGDTKQ